MHISDYALYLCLPVYLSVNVCLISLSSFLSRPWRLAFIDQDGGKHDNRKGTREPTDDWHHFLGEREGQYRRDSKRGAGAGRRRERG